MHRAPNRFALALSALALGIALPAVAEMRIEKTLKLDPGGEFRLDTDMGKVTLVGSSDSDVHVVLTSRRKDLDELMTFRWDESPGLVSITARKRQKFSWFSNSGSSVQYEVRVPTQTRVSVETSGGGINITGIQGEVKADTSGGGIGITNVAGDVFAETSGGGISLENIKGRVLADTSGGGIDAVAIEGPIRAESSGGSIELERVTGDIDADTSGGGITIVEAGGRVKADTSGGGIEASFARGNSLGGTLRPRAEASRCRSIPERPRDRGLRQCRQDGSASGGSRRDLRAEVSRARSGRAATRCASTRAEARSGSSRCNLASSYSAACASRTGPRLAQRRSTADLAPRRRDPGRRHRRPARVRDDRRRDPRREDRLRRRAPPARCPPGWHRRPTSRVWITPGLVDAHVHFSQTGGPTAAPTRSTCATAIRTTSGIADLATPTRALPAAR